VTALEKLAGEWLTHATSKQGMAQAKALQSKKAIVTDLVRLDSNASG